MELGIRGKAAIVTGGSRGIGKGIAEVLAREGVDLCLVARDQTALEQNASDFAKRFGVKVIIKAADLMQPAEAQAAVSKAVSALGGIDILVNSAGATKRGDFVTLTDEDWASGYGLKLHGTVRMCRAAWPHLEARRGSIVNIVGVGARTPSAEFTIGGSVNSALVNFSKALADLGLSRGVRVNAINPGYIESDRLSRRIAAAMKTTGHSRDDVVKGMLRDDDLQRFGRPEEVGNLVAFLTSPAADYINGATLDIDGGKTKGI